MNDSKTAVVSAVASAAVSSVASGVVDKALSVFLSEAKLSDDAQRTITKMAEAVPGFDEKFLNSLKRDDFGRSVKQWISGHVFDGGKTAHHLLQHQIESTKRSVRLTEPNLKKTLVFLIVFQGEIASYFNQHSTEATTDRDHSHVLILLHHTIYLLVQRISDHNNPGNEQVDTYTRQLEELRKAYRGYVNRTKTQTDVNNRRGTIADNLDKIVKKIYDSMQLCKTSRTLQSCIHTLRESLEDFSVQLQRVLFAIIILPGEDAAKKPDKSNEMAWTDKQLFLERLLVTTDKESILLEKEMKSIGYERSVLGIQAEGTIYKNPFAERMKKIAEGYRKSAINPAVKPEKKQLFYGVLLEVCGASKESRTTKSVQKTISEFAARYNDEKSTVGKFSMLQGKNGKTMLLKDKSDVGGFLQAMLTLFQQSTELARFLKALNNFMAMVGKVGMHNQAELHTHLKNLIETACEMFIKNFKLITNSINDSARARGMGFDLLKEWFDQIHISGSAIIKQDMDLFAREFAKISDDEEMNAEFEKVKNELMEAAVGIAIASNLEGVQVKNLKVFISTRRLEQFMAAPIHSGVSHTIIEHQHRLTKLTVDHTVDVTKQNAQLAHELQIANGQCKQMEEKIADFKKVTQDLHIQNGGLQTKLSKVEDKIKQKDNEVITFVKTLTEQLRVQQVANQTSIDNAQALIQINTDSKREAPNENADKSLQIKQANLEKAYLLLSELNGAQKATDKLVNTVTEFGAKYAIHAEEVNADLRELQAIAHTMRDKIKDLEHMTAMLQGYITTLKDALGKAATRVTELEKQNKELLERQNRLEADREKAISEAVKKALAEEAAKATVADAKKQGANATNATSVSAAASFGSPVFTKAENNSTPTIVYVERTKIEYIQVPYNSVLRSTSRHK